ncbi:MAG: PilZ domain-containing protein [Nitrospirae bacterium]|nr:PilZ domain-containing protein [Nitrospirota bacterium]
MNRNREDKIDIENIDDKPGAASADKRAVDRIQKNMFIKFFSGNSTHSGIILNLSEKGMFISTKVALPMEPRVEILIPLKEEILKVNGTIKNIVKAGKIYNGIGVELSNPANSYLQFINHLRTYY